jgi:hypothetical protein
MKCSKNIASHTWKEKTIQVAKIYKPNSLIIGTISGKMLAICLLVIAFATYFFNLVIEAVCSSKTSGFIQTT